MRVRNRTARLVAWGAVLVGVVVAMPRPVALADDPGRDARPAILRGRVTDKAGAPLADVRVRVAIPAVDMRFLDVAATSVNRGGFGFPREPREARTDAKGEYRLEIPALAGPTTISIDAMKPGYRRLVERLMAGRARRVEIAPGAEAKADLILKPALYFSGVVVDDRGKPIPGVEIFASAAFPTVTGPVETTFSRSDGSFEIFNYPEKPDAFQGRTMRGLVWFSEPDHIGATIQDLYKIEPGGRRTLRVVLATGCKMSGTVLDAVGKPVPGVTIRITRKAGGRRKATRSDEQGRFTVRGLSPGLTLLKVRSLAIKQKAQMPMALHGDKDDLEVRLRPMGLPADPGKIEVLGMQLADVTPALKDAYDLRNDRGALILDPGRDPGRLKIGEIAEGDVFWKVGQKRVGSVREFIDRILAEAGRLDAEEYRIRVVYTLTRMEFDGTSTKQLRLKKRDIEQLRALSEQLSDEPE